MTAVAESATIATGPAADESASPPSRREMVLGAAWASGVYVASRVVVFLAMGVAGVVREDWPLRRALGHWDGGWYLQIADFGYSTALPPPGAPPNSNLAFFPLFPLVVRGVAEATGASTFRVAVAVNVLFGIAASVLVWLLARRLGNRRFADRSAALFAFFPASFVLSMVYSEALMITLAAGCLYFLVRHRWVLAGAFAAVGSAARPNAIALCAACAVGAALAVWRERDWRALVAPALSPLGLFAFVAYLWRHAGDPFIWTKAQRSGWGQSFDGGWAMVRAAGRQLVHPGSDLNEVTAGVSLVFVVVALGLLVWWKPPAVLSTFAVVVVALGYLSPTLSSRPRFALTAFPLALAVAHRSGRAYPAVLASSAAVLGAFCVISVSTLAITP